MNSLVIVTPKAREDIVEIADYLSRQSLEVAMRFLDRVEASFEQLARMPELGTVCPFRGPETVGTRVWPVTGFPNHLIFYRPNAEQLRVVRIMHGAQDWISLLDQS